MDFLPTWAFYLAAAVVGLEIGGFATIFIQRWIDEQPICKPGRSICPSCREGLGWRDTIPVVSYLWLRGRCRHCGVSIGPQYMLTELSCLAWSLAVAHAYGPSAEWAVYLVLGAMLITGSFIDFETFLLPDRITLGGTGLALAASFVLSEGPGWQDAVLGASAGAGLFWVLQQAYRLWRKEEGLGTGDVKLMAMIGAMTGLAGLPLTILVGSVTGGVGSVYYAIRPGKGGIRGRIPYGPFLSLGCMIYLLHGPEIMRWWNS
ncbi:MULTISPECIES: A24 family peptidase [unclassified Pseudodesulfovibrio]|uniref:prepilin peptidase n=1 Tax=unclassified Pseudodesulfovibrio TaxID=2661612 RepID=UPI000FEB797D|nr:MULTISPECIES: A24 family peptidase [unclassified Pseudodesulfovibrio]MCJ2164599.1 A24 family peptidase [Pseudodesulfovibrio sp. S3-i]RWU04207.1 prepilin peptidase [Pseudodesulfovibrio sp. S3]